jgi:hypothetical protein
LKKGELSFWLSKWPIKEFRSKIRIAVRKSTRNILILGNNQTKIKNSNLKKEINQSQHLRMRDPFKSGVDLRRDFRHQIRSKILRRKNKILRSNKKLRKQFAHNYILKIKSRHY